MGMKKLQLFLNYKYNMMDKFFNDATATLGHYGGDSLTHPILITDGVFETEPSNSIKSL